MSDDQAIGHRPEAVTASRSASSFAGPMPRTSSSSSTERNGPFFVRWSMIAFAVAGPTPGSESSCSAVAVLRSIGAARGRADRRRRRTVVEPATPTSDAAGLADRRDHHSDAVGQRLRQVHLIEVGVRTSAPRGGDRVGDASTRPDGDQSRMHDRADTSTTTRSDTVGAVVATP